MLPRNYDKPLTYERTRGLRLYFLYGKGGASEPARSDFDQAAKLCGQLIGTMEKEFHRHPEQIHALWQREM